MYYSNNTPTLDPPLPLGVGRFIVPVISPNSSELLLQSLKSLITISWATLILSIEATDLKVAVVAESGIQFASASVVVDILLKFSTVRVVH